MHGESPSADVIAGQEILAKNCIDGPRASCEKAAWHRLVIVWNNLSASFLLHLENEQYLGTALQVLD
jgi:hypothetical protein